MRKLTIEEVRQKIMVAHGDTIFLDESTYLSTNKKARFVDKDFGEWWSWPSDVFLGRRHPKRFYSIMAEQRKLSEEEINKKLINFHNGVVSIDVSTYKNANTKAKFIDKDFGEWWALPSNVIFQGKSHPSRESEKKKNTWLKNLGVEHPSKDPKILKKMCRSQSHAGDFFHWKTGEQLSWTGSYEKKVVEWLNQNKIDFDWQIPFDMPNGKRYFVDLFLKDEATYIEVKGYFRKDAKEKWDWFHKEHPNSELWNEKKLKEKGVL